jgi:hypothetical protein
LFINMTKCWQNQTHANRCVHVGPWEENFSDWAYFLCNYPCLHPTITIRVGHFGLELDQMNIYMT